MINGLSADNHLIISVKIFFNGFDFEYAILCNKQRFYFYLMLFHFQNFTILLTYMYDENCKLELNLAMKVSTCAACI